MQATAFSVPSEGFPASLPAALLLLLFLSSCTSLSTEDTRRINEALNDSLTSSTEAWNSEITILEEERVKVRIRGSYAATFNRPDTTETRIQGPVHISLYDTSGTEETDVTANRAVYLAQSQEIQLYGDVRVETRTQRTLSSEYLKWDQTDNRINTPRFVVITTPTDTLAGTGFTGTTDLSDYTIRKIEGSFIVN